MLGRLYGWIALAVFLALDGPLVLVRALVESYQAIPAGRLLISQETAELAFGQVGRALELSLRAAAPPALALTLAGVVLGWLSRAAPSLPFVALALPIRSCSRRRSGHAQPGHVGRHACQHVGHASFLTEALSCPMIGHNRRRSDAGNWRGSTGRSAHSPELTAAAGWLAAVVLLGIVGDDLALGLTKLASWVTDSAHGFDGRSGRCGGRGPGAGRGAGLAAGGDPARLRGGALAAHQLQVRGLWATGLLAPD